MIPAVVFAFALLVRIPFMWTQGYPEDVFQYSQWTWKAFHFGIYSLYDATHGITSDNYPLCLFPFKVIGLLYNALTGSFERISMYDPLLRFLLRTPAVICDLAIGIGLYFWTKRRHSEKIAVTAAALYMFNPGIIFDSALYGQIDSIHAAFCLFAFLLILDCRPVTAGILIGLAAFQKPQSFALFPIFAATIAQRQGTKGLLKAFMGATAAGVVATAPFILGGSLPNLFKFLLSTAAVHPTISWYADNFWLLLYGRDAFTMPDTARAWFLPFSYRVVGIGLVASFYGYIIRRSLKTSDPSTLLRWAAISVLVFFFFATQMHENYLYLALPLLAFAAPDSRHARILYAVLSGLFFINMTLYYPAFLDWVGGGSYWINSARRMDAIAHLLILGWALWSFQDSVTIGRTPDAKRTKGANPA